MIVKQMSARIAIAALLISSNAARAEDSVYLGDCERARIVQQQSTIDKLIPHWQYEGTQRAQFPFKSTDVCVANTLAVYTLTERSRSVNSVVFSMVRNDVFFSKRAGCATVSLGSKTYSGTVTFTTAVEQAGELCDVYIKANWTHEGPNKLTDFWNRVISMKNGAFVISQPASADGVFRTPLAFTGI